MATKRRAKLKRKRAPAVAATPTGLYVKVPVDESTMGAVAGAREDFSQLVEIATRLVEELERVRRKIVRAGGRRRPRP